MNDIVKIADHASQQTDRWLLVALIVTIGLASFGLWRWIVGDRNKTENRLTAMTDRHIAMTEKLSDVVANNTAALNGFKETLNEMKKR